MQLVVEDLDSYLPVTLSSPGLSDKEFADFCLRYPDYRVEYSAEGEIIVMPPTDMTTGFRNSFITHQLTAWALRDGRGRAFDSSTGFLLPNGARRSPDASWVDNRRLPAVSSSERFPILCPEFVIELKSPSDRVRKLEEKMLEWVENGARLAWLINPDDRSATIYRPGSSPQRLENPSQLSGEDPVDGFLLDLARVWSGQ
jgi:Uma2 family endonuclease